MKYGRATLRGFALLPLSIICASCGNSDDEDVGFGPFSACGGDVVGTWSFVSSNVDIDAAVKLRRFREDLFYRLNVIHIEVPPLRERKEDLYRLIQLFVKQYAAKHGRKIERVSPAALKLLQAYEFPGNARELAKYAAGRAVVPDASGCARSTSRRRTDPGQ